MVARDDECDAKSERNDMSSDFKMSRCQDDSGVVEKAHSVDSEGTEMSSRFWILVILIFVIQ